MTTEPAEPTIVVPPRPNPGCRKCFGRGHMGVNIQTGKYRTCPKCYPNTAETKLPPLELIEKLEAAQADPEQWEAVQMAMVRREKEGLDE